MVACKSKEPLTFNQSALWLREVRTHEVEVGTKLGTAHPQLSTQRPVIIVSAEVSVLCAPHKYYVCTANLLI